MKNSVFQLFFSLLIATFSLIWISDKLSMVIENEKQGYCQTTEKNDAENQTENKLKTQFIGSIEHINLASFALSDPNKNSTFYLLNAKEISFENPTPPPEHS